MAQESTITHEIGSKVKDNIQKVIVGKEEQIDFLFLSLLVGGHVLLEDVPGTGKTKLARAFSRSMDLSFSRIQFTIDLLPSDLTGIHYFDKKTDSFIFRKGPLFTNVLLADEINRATARTQSSLLECMEEKQITVDGETNILEAPFFVIATQNPLETQGTFPLPEAQLDRAMQLLHPFMPFLTEEVYSYLVLDQRCESIMVSDWPTLNENEIYESEEKQMELLMDAIRSIRNVRTNMGVVPSRKTNVILVTNDDQVKEMFLSGKAFLERLASVSDVHAQNDKNGIPVTAVACVFGGGEIYIPLEDLIDIDKECERLNKEKARLEGELARVDGKLNNQEFVGKAPERVIAAEREKRVTYQEMLQNIMQRLTQLTK